MDSAMRGSLRTVAKKLFTGSTVTSVELGFINPALDLPKSIFVCHVIDYLRYHYCFFQV